MDEREYLEHLEAIGRYITSVDKVQVRTVLFFSFFPPKILLSYENVVDNFRILMFNFFVFLLIILNIDLHQYFSLIS